MHANIIKTNIIKVCKLALYLKTNAYELILTIYNNKVNWETKPLNIPNELSTGFTLYNVQLLSLK